MENLLISLPAIAAAISAIAAIVTIWRNASMFNKQRKIDSLVRQIDDCQREINLYFDTLLTPYNIKYKNAEVAAHIACVTDRAKSNAHETMVSDGDNIVKCVSEICKIISGSPTTDSNTLMSLIKRAIDRKKILVGRLARLEGDLGKPRQ